MEMLNLEVHSLFVKGAIKQVSNEGSPVFYSQQEVAICPQPIGLEPPFEG